MLYSFYQWLLSLLPDCMTEPAAGAGGTTPHHRTHHHKGTAAMVYSDTTTGDAATGYTLQDVPPTPPTPPTPQTPPPQDVPNSRGARAVPQHGTEPPEPVKEAPTVGPDTEHTQQPEDKPGNFPPFTMKDKPSKEKPHKEPLPEIVYDWKPKGRKDHGRE